MNYTSRPKVAYNVLRLAEDMAAKGWMNQDLAREAGVSDMTITRFLRGERQTARTAKRLALALGYSISRYLLRTAAVGKVAP
jgi:transcriptional regulator with XRE-family HTH domain